MQVGRYQVIRKLREGGMGEVLLARDPARREAGGLVVVKRMSRSRAGDDQFVSMFRNEIRISRLLDSPHLPRALDDGVEDDAPYLVLEYIHGADLKEVLGVSTARLDPALAAYTAAGVAAALDHAHGLVAADGTPMRLVHRDISPHNIRLGHAGEVKVIDFGVAKTVDQSFVTAAGVTKGKFGYMSPEQLTGTVDGQTDIFALGIVMHEMLTYRQLFAHSDPALCISAIQKARIPRPSELTGAAIPEELEAIVMRALQRDRSARYASAGELLQELRGFLSRTRAGAAELARLMDAIFGDADALLAAVSDPDDDEIPMESGVIEAGELDLDVDGYDDDGTTVKGRPSLPGGRSKP